MQQILTKIRKYAGWGLIALSVYMVYDGILLFISTSGSVRGSEFGMQITLVNMLSLVLLWLALFTFWKVVPESLKE